MHKCPQKQIIKLFASICVNYRLMLAEPEQLCSLQDWLSKAPRPLSSTAQSKPPYWGGGSVQVRWRSM